MLQAGRWLNNAQVWWNRSWSYNIQTTHRNDGWRNLGGKCSRGGESFSLHSCIQNSGCEIQTSTGNMRSASRKEGPCYLQSQEEKNRE